mmetsp:Transcript_43904/g.59942  ORF Transcript_43904/g.59942 Transcript_43904/m.59942 type:complete len:253 (-) Transcript_43904:335-1093(-)
MGQALPDPISLPWVTSAALHVSGGTDHSLVPRNAVPRALPSTVILGMMTSPPWNFESSSFIILIVTFDLTTSSFPLSRLIPRTVHSAMSVSRVCGAPKSADFVFSRNSWPLNDTGTTGELDAASLAREASLNAVLRFLDFATASEDVFLSSLSRFNKEARRLFPLSSNTDAFSPAASTTSPVIKSSFDSKLVMKASTTVLLLVRCSCFARGTDPGLNFRDRSLASTRTDGVRAVSRQETTAASQSSCDSTRS